jgi:hypothetical protein
VFCPARGTRRTSRRQDRRRAEHERPGRVFGIPSATR